MESLAIGPTARKPHLHSAPGLQKDICSSPRYTSTSSDRDQQTRRTAPSLASRCPAEGSKAAYPRADGSNMSTIVQDVSATTLSDRRTVREGGNDFVFSKTEMILDPLPQNNMQELLYDGSGPGRSPGGLLPPTPPAESRRTFPWHTQHTSLSRDSPRSLSSQQERSHTSQGTAQNTDRSASRPNTIVLPGGNNMTHQLNAPSTSLNRAIDALVECCAYTSNSSAIQMVVQALPSQIRHSTIKPTFHKAAERLQQRGPIAPYLTISHALSGVGIDQIPASPPATPNLSDSGDNYFQRQTIFTHGAPVHTYHGPRQMTETVGLMGTILPPTSVHFGLLERYIPPTGAQEFQDFFSNSHRSYLTDRLIELSMEGGALLLTYPTKKGAATFARDYIGPVLEPFIRYFCILNGLTTDIATALGKTGACESILEFDEMRNKIGGLCESFASIAPAPNGQKSKFQIIHSENVDIVLDRKTWTEWFIEQESARMRQALVDYQKGGGRMPSREFGASPAALVREIEEGIRTSRETAGGSDIEIGVFVICRSSQ